MVSESVYGGRYGAIVALHAIPKSRTSRVGLHQYGNSSDQEDTKFHFRRI